MIFAIVIKGNGDNNILSLPLRNEFKLHYYTDNKFKFKITVMYKKYNCDICIVIAVTATYC
jgi:hypothetical protein